MTGENKARENNWFKKWAEFKNLNPELKVETSHLSSVLQYPSRNASQETDEAFWKSVQETYPSSNRILNLNNGAVSSAPLIVEDAYIRYYQLVNQAPGFYLLSELEKGKDLIREGVSIVAGCEKEEVAFLRNATEALNNIIFGLDFNPGDEVVVCKQDYSKTISSWKQRALREGLKIVWLDLDLPNESDQSIIEKFASAITPRTRLVQITHVINWNGNILPVKEIIRAVKQRHVEVLVDGAHALGLLDTNLKDLDCDYYVSPLHKWLSAPATSAMMFIKKEKIDKVWPLASSNSPQADSILKFEELSLTFLPTFIAGGYALEYHFALGRASKEQRLRYLKDYWLNKIAGVGSFLSLTPADENRSCVIATIAHDSFTPNEIQEYLMNKHDISVGIVNWETLKGIRITPNVYTKISQLDYFINAISKL